MPRKGSLSNFLTISQPPDSPARAWMTPYREAPRPTPCNLKPQEKLILKEFGLRTLIFYAIFFLSLQLHAASVPRCDYIFDETHAPTQRMEKNKFITNRGLEEYFYELHPDFKTKLKSLGSQDHWIDLGAGKVHAQIDFLKTFSSNNQAPQVTAVAYKLDRWFPVPRFSGKLTVKEGLFEKMATQDFTKAAVITDVFGVLSYSKDLSLSLQKTVDLLETKGELYILTTPYTTRIQRGNETFSLIEYLATIPGLKVEGRWGVIKVTKEVNNLLIPQLELHSFKDDAPPYRQFREALHD